jgi:hypothetical protein
MTKSFDLDGNRVFLIPDRDEVGGVEKLKTMSCDDIEALLSAALTELNCSGCYLMSNCLYDLIWPIREERERAEYCWVLASEYPNEPGLVCWGLPEELTEHPEVDPAELRALGKLVEMKRIKRQ